MQHPETARAAPGSAPVLAALRGLPDPLRRAQALLAHHQSSPDTSAQSLADLRHAQAVFEANHLQAEATSCLQAEVYALRVRGAAQCAWAVIRRALESRTLNVEERTSLAYQGLHALTQLLRFDEADAWAERHLVPALEGPRAVRPRAIWWIALGYLQTQHCVRAAGHASALAIDLDPDRQRDAPQFERRLARAVHCLDMARATARHPGDTIVLAGYELTVEGLRADLAVCRRLHAALAQRAAAADDTTQAGIAVNWGLVLHSRGQRAEAYACLVLAAARARRCGARGPLHLASYALGRLARDLGDAEGAARHYEEFIALDAEMRRQSESWFDEAADLSTYGPRPAGVPTHPAQLRTARPPYLRRAITLLEERLDHPPGVAELAAAVGVGARALQAAMKRYEGMSPVAFVRHRRMHAAHRQIEATTRTLTDIASRLGYAHMASFSRDFRKVFGTSPTSIRQACERG